MPLCSVVANITEHEEWIRASQTWAIILTAVGCLGNFFTIVVIIHQWHRGYVWRKMPPSARNPDGQYLKLKTQRPTLVLDGHTVLLLNLCFCDFLYCVINLPVTTISYEKAFSYPENEIELQRFCKPAAFFRHWSAFAEWLTLGLLAFQRCVDLSRWQSARFFRPKSSVYSVAAIWVGSFAVQAIPFIENGYGYCPANFKCDMTSKTFKVMFFTLNPLIPSFMVFCGCIGIIFQLRKHHREMKRLFGPCYVTVKGFDSTMKTTVLTLSLLLLFLVCIIPMCIYNAYCFIVGSIDVSTSILLYMIYWIQYAFNFVLYTTMSENFRKAYRQFLSTLRSACCGPESKELSQAGPEKGTLSIIGGTDFAGARGIA